MKIEVFSWVGCGGDFGFPGLIGEGIHSRDIFGLHGVGGSAAGMYRVEAGDAVKHLAICKSTPAPKLDWALNSRPTF